MEKEFYFKTDDRLGREKYAAFLKTLLQHCDEYRREDSDGAYVIAIDSPWGTGKTRFAKMLQNYLVGHEPSLVDGIYNKAQVVQNKDSRFNAIYYNSWETDYWGDALEPLIHCILNSELFMPILAEKDTDTVTGNLWNATKGVLAAVGLGFARNIMGDPAVDVIKNTFEEMKKEPNDPLSAYKQSINDYNSFKDSLTTIIKSMGKKLVIIVDELDRCRPTFAIQTLELAKHLFDVEGIVFIFALDIKQLSCSVETVYGKGMDAPGYLCRFFDYIGKMPTTNQRDFIELCLKQHRAFTATPEPWTFKIPDYIAALTISFSLSMRDLTTIMITYQLILDSYLFKYKFPQFHFLYLFLLTLKYKKGSLYSEFLLQKKNEDTKQSNESTLTRVKKYLPEIAISDKDILANQLQQISVKSELSNREFSIYSGFIERVQREQFAMHCIVETTKLESDNKGNMKLAFYPRLKDAVNDKTYPGNPEFLDNTNVLNDVLEINDLYSWESIKRMSLGNYYYQQLEMFNFALSSEESES